MKTVSFYHRETGLLNGQMLIASDDEAVALNTPPDHAAIDGHHDPLTKRVDVDVHKRQMALNAEILTQEDKQRRQAELDALQAKVLVDYQPPAPSADHEWNVDAKRWQLSAAATDRVNRQAAAVARIAELVGSQHQHVRDLLLGNLAARPRLQAIADEIEKLSADL